jgi:hypothetical protein
MAGYAEVSQMTGKVGTLPVHSECAPGTWQSLCCASGTQYGTCQWRGYRGLGLDCYGGCLNGETQVAQNTNHLEWSSVWNSHISQTCFIGYQTYCCTDFDPPVEMPQLNLLGEEGAWSDTEDVSGWSDWRIENEAAACPDLSVLVSSEGATALLEKGIPVDLGLVKRGFDSSSRFATAYLMCFTANSVYKTVVNGKISGYAAAKTAFLGIGPVKIKGPPSNVIKNVVGNSAPKVGGYVSRARTIFTLSSPAVLNMWQMDQARLSPGHHGLLHHILLPLR